MSMATSLKIFSWLRLKCFEAVSWCESLKCQHRSLFQCRKVWSNNLSAAFFFSSLHLWKTYCCKLAAEVASPVSAAEPKWVCMLVDQDGLPRWWLVAAGANFPCCSLMVLQECMVFSIGKTHSISCKTITATAVENLGSCLLKGLWQLVGCFYVTSQMTLRSKSKRIWLKTVRHYP